jgi:hypothetical protein
MAVSRKSGVDAEAHQSSFEDPRSAHRVNEQRANTVSRWVVRVRL